MLEKQFQDTVNMREFRGYGLKFCNYPDIETSDEGQGILYYSGIKNFLYVPVASKNVAIPESGINDECIAIWETDNSNKFIKMYIRKV